MLEKKDDNATNMISKVHTYYEEFLRCNFHQSWANFSLFLICGYQLLKIDFEIYLFFDSIDMITQFPLFSVDLRL